MQLTFIDSICLPIYEVIAVANNAIVSNYNLNNNLDT